MADVPKKSGIPFQVWFNVIVGLIFVARAIQRFSNGQGPILAATLLLVGAFMLWNGFIQYRRPNDYE